MSDTESAKLDSDAGATSPRSGSPRGEALGDSEALEKPKKKITRRFEWTEKRREAWAKALETRKKNVQARKDELVADYIKRNGVPKEEEDTTVSEEDSDSSYEVIVKTKKKPKPKPRQRVADSGDGAPSASADFEPNQTPTQPSSTGFEFLWV